MPGYHEIAPRPELSRSVECYRTGFQNGAAAPTRVMPDGCADILFTRRGGTVRLDAVGPMTRYSDYTLETGQVMVGVRFRPGAWRPLFGIPGDRLTDRIVPLEEFWGKRARRLLDRLAAARSWQECTAILSPPRAEPPPIERVVAWMERRHGCVTMDEVARECGISPRQLRRTFLEQTGLSPKFLARVVRFRRALGQAPHAGGDFAGLALDCGYYDQAHLIRDFREFAGRTPGAYAAGRFLQAEDGASAVASQA